MELISERGTFSSFQTLRAAYLESNDGLEYWKDPTPFGQEEWEKDKLHASEIGGCPRATAYRLLGTPEKPRSESSKANRAIIFWAGYRLHFLTYSALDWADLLMTYEHPVDLGDGWAGSLDAVFLPDWRSGATVLYDMKTVLPNALKYTYDMPKKKDCLQLGMYASAKPILSGVVEYADRAGSNDPYVAPVDLPVWVPKALERKALLESVRDNLPELPPCMEPEYKGHYTKPRNQPYKELASISYEPAWNCGYCDYHLTQKVGKFGVTQKESVCHPHNDPPLTVAKFSSGGALDFVKSGHEAGVESWLAQNRKRYDLDPEAI